MANYWLIREDDGPVEGPFSAAQLKSMVQARMLEPTALIADSAGKWVSAGSISQLFPAISRSIQPIAAPQFEGYSLEPGFTKPPVIPPPMVHASPTFRPRWVGRSRNLAWFIVLTSLLTLFGLATVVASVIEEISRGSQRGIESLFDPDAPLLLSDYMNCFGLFGTVALWIIWVIWIYKAHDDLRKFANGEHSISPGLAIGLCFVPLFNFFWQVYMPYRLAQFLEQHLAAAPTHRVPPHAFMQRHGSRSATVGAGTVLALQIVGILGCCCIPGVQILLFSISTLIMQRGLNQLWEGYAAVAVSHLSPRLD